MSKKTELQIGKVTANTGNEKRDKHTNYEKTRNLRTIITVIKFVICDVRTFLMIPFFALIALDPALTITFTIHQAAIHVTTFAG